MKRLARPKRFELLTPRFAVCDKSLILLPVLVIPEKSAPSQVFGSGAVQLSRGFDTDDETLPQDA
jgi:hypothetical protein